MNKILKVLTFLLLVPINTSAQIVNPIGGTTAMDTIPQFLQALLSVVVQIGSMVLVIMIVYAGYLFVTAQGNMESLKKAKHTLKWAVLGGALLLGAWALSVGISDTISTL